MFLQYVLSPGHPAGIAVRVSNDPHTDTLSAGLHFALFILILQEWQDKQIETRGLAQPDQKEGRKAGRQGNRSLIG